jgi:hypothetical protein
MEAVGNLEKLLRKRLRRGKCQKPSDGQDSSRRGNFEKNFIEAICKLPGCHLHNNDNDNDII